MCMYYALTTLATVGYGDMYPTSIMEKLTNIFVQLAGVTIFSALMQDFIGVVLSLRGNDMNDKESELDRWQHVIRAIKN